jgi:DNA-binding helix-hairpin-helix protein with protein kinase domain
MPQFFDHNGRQVVIGSQLGNGGEGAVFDVAGQPSWVAKIYHRSVPPAKGEKLAAMVSSASKDILAFAAWPVATLHKTRGGEPVGLVMPRISKAKDIHQLYSPAQRRSLYPFADWQFLLRTARNCAAAFDTLHKRGIVIGDVNQGNALVSDKALVNLIDCDSFQVRANGTVYLCEVGVPHFTPPELQNAHFDQVSRTQNHDCFGLALLIFHLLFVGRHPFAGRYFGKGDMPIEQAIREYRFAYSRNGSGSQMSPPPFSLPISVLPVQLGDYFEQAFGRGSEAPNGRPTAANWASALESLERNLRKCRDDHGHIFPSTSPACPWCQIIRQNGPNFFISVTIIRGYVGHGPQIDTAATWAEIVAIKYPDEPFHFGALAIGHIIPQPLPDGIEDNRFLRSLAGWAAVAGGAIAALGFVIGVNPFVGLFLCTCFFVWWFILMVVSPVRRIRTDRARKVKGCRSELVKVRQQAEFIESTHRNSFFAERASLENIKASIEALEQMRTAALQKLQDEVRERQLEAHLESFYINDAKIKGIGPGRVSALLSNGIETAADLREHAMLSIPGFGPSLTASLVAWRNGVVGKFRFDPSKGVPQSEVQSIEIQFLQRKNTLGCELQAGPNNLRSILSAAKSQLQQVGTRVAKSEQSFAQANADLKACG